MTLCKLHTKDSELWCDFKTFLIITCKVVHNLCKERKLKHVWWKISGTTVKKIPSYEAPPICAPLIHICDICVILSAPDGSNTTQIVFLSRLEQKASRIWSLGAKHIARVNDTCQLELPRVMLEGGYCKYRHINPITTKPMLLQPVRSIDVLIPAIQYF